MKVKMRVGKTMNNGRKLKPFPWVGSDNREYNKYMNTEWGHPVRRDRKLFEMLILECFQAGLSWATILKRRDNFKRAFVNWDFQKVANFKKAQIERLRRDEGIIRNRLKIVAAIQNAKAFIAVREEFGSFSKYIWSFTAGKPILPDTPYKDWSEVPAQSPLSVRISKDLKTLGFSFVGPVAIYAFLQATGIVDDRVWE